MADVALSDDLRAAVGRGRRDLAWLLAPVDALETRALAAEAAARGAAFREREATNEVAVLRARLAAAEAAVAGRETPPTPAEVNTHLEGGYGRGWQVATNVYTGRRDAIEATYEPHDAGARWVALGEGYRPTAWPTPEAVAAWMASSGWSTPWGGWEPRGEGAMAPPACVPIGGTVHSGYLLGCADGACGDDGAPLSGEGRRLTSAGPVAARVTGRCERSGR